MDTRDDCGHGDRPGAGGTDCPPHRSKELRLALAMRGGVSLAVWMGGACQEMAALRNAAPTADCSSDFYDVLLRVCGYQNAEIDVLAGTSAGGLNAVLLASHLVHGMPFAEGVRNLWLELGDLEGLLRTESRPFRVPDSLLRGDEAFYERLRDAMVKLVDAPGDKPAPATSLRLIITASRLHPRRDWVRPTLGQPLLVGRSQAHFRFRHRHTTGPVAQNALTDFYDDGETGRALARLAYAARCSSSYPGAFEPGRPRVAEAAPPPQDDVPFVDLSGISSETGCPDPDAHGRVQLLDGGLLDNIPVAWAVRAVAGAPVTRRPDRWLLFLQPVPPFPPPPQQPTGSRRRVTRLLRTLAASLSMKMGSESLLDDVQELRTAAAGLARQQGIAGVLPDDLPGLLGAANTRFEVYRHVVGTAEADRIARLLQDPTEVTGPDPLPLPTVPGPLDVLDAAGGDTSVRLLAALRRQADELATPELPQQTTSVDRLAVSGRTPLAPARAVRLLMDWLRACEIAAARSEGAAVPDFEDLWRRLYAVRLAAAATIAARDRLLLHTVNAAAADGVPGRPVPLVIRASTRLEALLTPLPPLPSDPPIPPNLTDLTDWEAWAGCLAQRVTVATAPHAPARPAVTAPRAPAPCAAPEWPVHLYEDLWDRLAGLGIDIAVVARVPAPEFAALHQASARGTATMRTALTAAEVLLGPLRPDPLAEATDIGLHTVSAATRSWATDTVLAEGGRPGPASAEELVAAKLSGNQLNNFAAFLSARWRMSDWTWGRLDAAASLVSIVATDCRLAARYGTGDDDRLLADLAADLEADLYALIDQGHVPLPGTPPTVPAQTPADLLGYLWGTVPGPERWDKVRQVLTAVRQRGILTEELPLIGALQESGAGDRPPGSPVPTVPVDTPEGFTGALKSFRDIGAETIGQLARKPDPRRTALRAGLLAWPALQPTGRRWVRLVHLGAGFLKPLLCVNPLLVLLAPLWAAIAAPLWWVAVAASTDNWFSPPGHGLVLALLVPLIVGVLIRMTANNWLRALSIGGALALLGGAVFLLDRLGTAFGTQDLAATATGVAYTLAAGVLLFPAAARRVRLPLIAVALGTGPALAVLFAGALPSWCAAALLYLVLLAVTGLYPCLYPRAKTDS
ncbi:patatin-like protein [Streptomyces sp. NPDC127068]|uniref:patatin-like protein n=1 Tax=Streptomyces sp. NPDC127068 TaxID=3347127 RepID=UPI003659D1D1